MMEVDAGRGAIGNKVWGLYLIMMMPHTTNI